METGRHQITTLMMNRSSEELWLFFPLKHIFLNSDKYIQELSVGSLRVSIMNNCYYSAQEAGVNHDCEAAEKTKWNKHETRRKLKRKLYKARLLEAQHRTSLPSARLFYNGTKQGMGKMLSFSSSCLLLTCIKKKRREEEGSEEDAEGVWDWTRSLFTQLKESCAQSPSLATCVLTFVFLSVVIYSSTELKDKLVARPASETGR